MKLPRITIKRILFSIILLTILWLSFIIVGVLPIPFVLEPVKEVKGYKYTVGNLPVGTYLKYAYSFYPNIESVHVLVTDTSLTSITANVTINYRNNSSITEEQVWYVGDYKFINDTDIPLLEKTRRVWNPNINPVNATYYDPEIHRYITITYPVGGWENETYYEPKYTTHFLEYAFIAGNLDYNDQIAPTSGAPIINRQYKEIRNLNYREVLAVDEYFYNMLISEMLWDRETGVLLAYHNFGAVKHIDLVETNLFSTNWYNLWTYVAAYQYMFTWVWMHIIWTKAFFFTSIAWLGTFAMFFVYDISKRKVFGASGIKAWLPNILVIVIGFGMLYFMFWLASAGAMALKTLR